MEEHVTFSENETVNVYEQNGLTSQSTGTASLSLIPFSFFKLVGFVGNIEEQLTDKNGKGLLKQIFMFKDTSMHSSTIVLG